MRCLFGFLCVCALGLVPLVGCSETAGDGGNGGAAGDGGSGGAIGQEFPCTEQGILDAIAEGGGPHTFACVGPTTVVIEATIGIDNNVILDGEGNLTVDGNVDETVFMVSGDVTAELHSFIVINGHQGIENHGNLKVTNSTVSDNTCGCSGAGIRNQGSITLINSTLSGNTAFSGGGLHNDNFAMAVLTNCTVSLNTANEAAGIYNDGGTLTVTNSTLSANRAQTFSGTAISHRAGTATLANSVVDGDCGAGEVITSKGYNIESPGNTCGFDQEGDRAGVTGAELGLGPLWPNGGPTKTHALQPSVPDIPGSAAIDQIPQDRCVDADGKPLRTDQRGEPRPAGDVGSFERQPDDQ